jgi:hypothetical protein
MLDFILGLVANVLEMYYVYMHFAPYLYDSYRLITIYTMVY